MMYGVVIAVMEWPCGPGVVAGLALHPCAEHDPESSVSAVSAACERRGCGYARATPIHTNVTPKCKEYKEYV